MADSEPTNEVDALARRKRRNRAILFALIGWAVLVYAVAILRMGLPKVGG